MKIAYMVGSLSADSLNGGLAKALVSMAPEGVEFVELNVGSLPLYNRDYDGNWPEIATEFKRVLDEVDGVIIVTPEHNRMYSAVIANAIEWSSRPWGTASLKNKPVLVAGVSPGPLSTGIAQTHLRGPLNFFGAKIYPGEAYINAGKAGITSDGGVDEGSRDYVAKLIGGFVDFVKTNSN